MRDPVEEAEECHDRTGYRGNIITDSEPVESIFDYTDPVEELPKKRPKLGKWVNGPGGFAVFKEFKEFKHED